MALLLGARPVIAVLRRRPPGIPDRTHAWTHTGLLTPCRAAHSVTTVMPLLT
ncbi:hypothetical protein NKH18_04570 [Streptomyces sp. M10(2022)]